MNFIRIVLLDYGKDFLRIIPEWTCIKLNWNLLNLRIIALLHIMMRTWACLCLG